MKKNVFKISSLHKYSLIFISLLFSTITQAQFFPAKSYPKGYFMYPVDATKSLSANFGELRANHYHMGLDCRTNQVENKKVWASADGFISRISIAPFGFGRAIYIQHPNGFTTVYGHLNSFYPELEKFLKNKQYELESWKVSLEFSPEQFPVKKGQLIAHSGNTGGSMGPHVHFEIRDTKTDKVFNPLLFDLPLPDKVSPSIVRLYMYDRFKSTYNQSPKNLPIKATGNNYTTTQPVITVHTDKVSFGISANDKLSGSNNPNGIYESIIYMDGKALSGFQLDSISYDETRYLNAHIDYKTKAAGGPYIQHLSRLRGYPEGVYKDINGDGVIELNDDKVHEIKIVVKDANGNSSNVEFKIKKGLIIENGNVENGKNYQNKNEFYPGFVNVYEGEKMQLYLSPKALYDSVTFSYSEKKPISADVISPVFTVLSGLIPSQDYFTIKLKPNQGFNSTLSEKILMRQSWGSKSEVVKTKKEGDWYVGKFRNFGNFELILDTISPTITGLANNSDLSKSSRIIITPKDENDEIVNFRAELDGKWLRFTNDKARNYVYIFDEKCPSGKHELKISVEDLAGNVTEKIFHFIR